MKKKISLLLSAVLMCGTAAFAAENEQSDKVEISFKIGDSILNINGSPVEVETPFIAGDGVTMVPLRVITEAFGAEVRWDGENRTIKINYPGVTLGFTIDSKKVNVNDHIETLEEAPVVLGEGTTMVPFRFISETFGATVEWDEATGGITVTKYNDGEENTTIQGAIEKDYITDSYYNWSMKNPKSLSISDIEFDRTKMTFSNTYGDKIAISINDKSDIEDFSLDKTLSNMRADIGSYAVISKSEKSKNSDGTEYIEVIAHDDENYLSFLMFVRDDTVYGVSAFTEIDRKSEFEELTSIVEGFRTSAMKTENAEDISNVENGYRTYTEDDMGISFKIPQDWKSVDISNSESLMFESADGSSSVTDYIFSVTDTDTAKGSAEVDRERQLNDYDPEVATVSDLQTKTVDGCTVYYYTVDVKGTTYEDMTMYDAFIENGNYVNNFTFQLSSNEECDFNTIINSIKITEIDDAETGNVLRTKFSDDLMLDYSLDCAKFKIPESWEVAVSDEMMVAKDHTSERVFTFYATALDENVSASDAARQVYSNITSEPAYTGKTAPKAVSIGGNSYYTFTYNIDDGELVTKNTGYIRTAGKDIYQIICSCPESYSIDALMKEVEEILANAEWK